MRLILILLLTASAAFSQGTARRMFGKPLCSTAPTTTGDLPTYSTVTGTWCPAAASGGTVTGTGTTNEYTYWSSSTGLTSSPLFVKTGTTPSTVAAGSPILFENSSGTFAMYLGHSGSAPTNYDALFDWKGVGANVHRFRLIDSGSNIADFTSSGSGWSMSGFAKYNTGTNCSSSASPGVCAAAAAGSVVVAAAATTVVVNTTAVTANSQILVMYDSSLGTKLGVTCNVTEPALYGVTARTAATSFTITASASVTNPACFSYFIVN